MLTHGRFTHFLLPASKIHFKFLQMPEKKKIYRTFLRPPRTPPIIFPLKDMKEYKKKMIKEKTKKYKKL